MGHHIYKILPLSEVLPFIGGYAEFSFPNILNQTTTNVYSLQKKRFLILKNGQDCVCCGVKGKFFTLEKQFSEAEYCLDKIVEGKCSLILYGVTELNRVVKLTVDHIVPVSKGGTNDISNLQLLCETCNHIKDNRIIYLDDLRDLREKVLSNPDKFEQYFYGTPICQVVQNRWEAYLRNTNVEVCVGG